MAGMTDAEREAFLAEPRYAILSTLKADGSAVAVPVWFDWDGRSVKMFTYAESPKMKRIARDPRASVLVTNHIDETERWVAFDGKITVHEAGGLQLAERMAPRYWDVDDPVRAKELESWRRMEADWRLLELIPEAIRTNVG